MQVEDLDAIGVELIAIREECDSVDDILKAAKERLRNKQTELIDALEKFDKTELEGPFGKLKITQREYYKMQDKQAAMQWLKDRGDFENMVTVNAQTMSSYIKALVGEKRLTGDHCWMAPGCVDSTSDYKTIKITRKK